MDERIRVAVAVVSFMLMVDENYDYVDVLKTAENGARLLHLICPGHSP